MHTNWLDSATREIATASISGYQKYLSPRKGFSCAHRLLYGGESCSQYVKRQIAQKGLAAAVKASRQRFQACRDANEILKARYRARFASTDNNAQETQEDTKQTKPKRKTPQSFTRSSDCDSCDGLDGLGDGCYAMADCGTDCSNFAFGHHCHMPDCSHCGSGMDCSGVDCASGLDCGGADCGSGLDCGGADCGSCG